MGQSESRPCTLTKQKRKQQQQLVANFNPDEAYDPSRPNDLVEYQQYRRRLRAERRAKYMEEKRRRDAGESSGSSYYTDSEEEAPRRDGTSLHGR
jgi:splicing factor 45